MKKISLKGISEILSVKEMKNVMGGSNDGGCPHVTCSRTCNGQTLSVSCYGSCSHDATETRCDPCGGGGDGGGRIVCAN